MDFKKLEYFIAAVEEGTFTKAATRCYISQTAISQQIAGLERELGVSLFDRSAYRPRLTPAGEVFYQCCNQMLQQFEQGVERVKQLAESKKKELSIGITGSYERLLLTKVLKRYVPLYPEIAINLIEHTISDCVSMLKDGTLDLLFLLSEDLKNESKLEVVELFLGDVRVLVPSKHILASRKEVRGSELAGERFIVFDPEMSPSWYRGFINACKKDGYEPIISQKVSSLYDIILMVGVGKGIAVAAGEIPVDES